MKAVQNRKEVFPDGRTIYTMDRVVCGRQLRQCVALTRFDQQHRKGIAMRLRHARASLRRACQFVLAHPPKDA